MKKVLAVIVFVCAMGGLGYLALGGKLSMTPAAAYTGYQSDKYGFTINYPSGWKVSVQNPGVDPKSYAAVVFNSPEQQAMQKGTTTVTVLPNIAVNYYDSVATLLDFEGRPVVTTSLASYIKTSPLMHNQMAITFAGEPAWEAKVEDLAEVDSIFVEHSGHIYAIGVSNRLGMSDQQLVDMINSFRFTR